MATFKCKMCGGNLEIQEGMTVCECEYCGTKQTLPKLTDDKKANMYDRANHFRRNNEFDKAMGIYEQILNEDTTDAETYWSIVLCRYGIEYVEDPATKKQIPTVNRAQYTSIFDDEDYKSAINNADTLQKTIYEEEARAINEIQKNILEISQKEEPFDVFICYKETDNNGRRTQDSVLATDLYHQLTQEGFKVFFSRITLEDKLGTAYEPYIFAALNSAKVMVVLGTKPEYFQAVWVRNEWSRYLALVKQSGGKKILIPAYRDMDPYDLPEEFSHLQAQDMGKLGFMQDLIRGIKKILQADAPNPSVAGTAGETVVMHGGESGNTAALLKRAFMFLEDGDFNSANEYCERVLDIDPENAEAYLGKLMVEIKVCNRDGLLNLEKPMDDSRNYQKAFRFGESEIRQLLETASYNVANYKMSEAYTENGYKVAANLFEKVSGFMDAEEKAHLCYEKAEEARKNTVYNEALEYKNNDTIKDLESAVSLFSQILDWKDAGNMIFECQRRIDEIKAQKEQDEIDRKDEILNSGIEKMKEDNLSSLDEAIEIFKEISGWKNANDLIRECKERKKEIQRKIERAKAEEEELKERERQQAINRKNRKIAICVVSVVVSIIFIIVLIKVIIPGQKYSKAMKMLDNQKYDEAYTLLYDLKKDEEVEANKYERAIKLKEIGEYNEAYNLLYSIGKNEEVELDKYERIIKLLDEEKYSEAYSLLHEIEKNGSIENKIYAKAENLIDSEDYISAGEFLDWLDDYGDSWTLYKEIAGKKVQQMVREQCEVGDIVEFGSDCGNIIRWRILDKENDRALLLSESMSEWDDYYSFIKEKGDTWNSPVITWEDSTLRSELNNHFYDKFSDYEKAIIQTTTVTNDDNPVYGTEGGNDTRDKIFILSIDEAEKYFSDNADRILLNNSGERKSWWLRSPGKMPEGTEDDDRAYAAYVRENGTIDKAGTHACHMGVSEFYMDARAAMWISLK